MQRVLSILLSSVLVVMVSACDSLDEEDDMERIQGIWTVTSISDEENDLSTEFQQFGQIAAEFGGDDFTFFANTEAVADQILATGTYEMEPVTNSILLSATVPGGDLPIPATYRFENDDELELTIQGETLQTVINAVAEQDIQFAGDVTFRTERAND